MTVGDGAPPPTETPKIEKVREWLTRVGYPLELRTARAFTSARATVNVVLGDVYRATAPEAGLREIDVAAEMATILHRPAAFDGRGVTMYFDLFTVCECKSNPKGHRPWIVFSDEHASMESTFRVQAHAATKLGEWLLREAVLEHEIERLELFAQPRLGHSVRCARLGDMNPRENDQDPAYEAVMSVLAAARAKADITVNGYEVFRIVLPLVVVDADLYECWLDRRDELKLEPRDEMAVLAKHQPGLETNAHSMIYIVREAALAGWIKRVEAAHYALSRNEELLIRGVAEARIVAEMHS